jgi:membrane-bound lytic murein transglycosylase B
VPRRLTLTLVVVALLTWVSPTAAATSSPGFASRSDVRGFIDEMAGEHGFRRGALRRIFSEVRVQASVVAAMQRPLLEPPKWYEYARPFLAAERVQGGVRWWSAHASELAQVEVRFGVPAEVIVAILGVETFYGRNLGRYRALDALATLAFDYPRRAAFFRGELREFLLLARELGVSPLVPKGSFAGALGVPQFMPGSYRRYAVDFDGNGRADLWTSAPDIVASVGRFLAEHGWQPGGPVLLGARIADERRESVLQRLDGGITERLPLVAWAEAGVTPLETAGGHESESIGLLSLEENAGGHEGASYWFACNNFYVLTRYNRSRLYATAVWELAKAIRHAREASRP